jgi:Putative peptidoglycan binding domain
MSVSAYASYRSAWPSIGCRRSSFPYWRCSRQAISTSRVYTRRRVSTPGSCTPLAAGDSGKCVSGLQALLDDNRPYPGITVDGYFGARTQQAVIDFQSAHSLAGTEPWRPRPRTQSMNSPRGRVFSAIRPGSRFEAGPADEAVRRGVPDSRGNHMSLAACRACLRQQPAPNSLCPAQVVRRACRGQLRSYGNPAGAGAWLGSQILLHHLDRADRYAAGPHHRGVSRHVRPPGLWRSAVAENSTADESRVWKLTGFLTPRRPRRGGRLRRSCGHGCRSSHPPTASHDHGGRHCGTWATLLPTWPWCSSASTSPRRRISSASTG